MRGHRPLRLSERLPVEAALEDAFAPLRSRRAELSPLRVRAAVLWGRGAPAARVRWSGVASRLSELSVAVGMSVMVFATAFGPPARVAAPSQDEAVYPVPRVSALMEDERYIRWLRLDRHVPLQDWLDPSIVRVGAARAAPRLDLPAPSGPHEPY